jgi:hypothetical protein
MMQFLISQKQSGFALCSSHIYDGRYARGEGGRDASENGPTGAAYSAAASAERERRNAIKEKERAAAEAKEQQERARETAVRSQFAKDQEDSDEEEGPAQEEEEVDSDDELLREMDGDPEVHLLYLIEYRHVYKI